MVFNILLGLLGLMQIKVCMSIARMIKHYKTISKYDQPTALLIAQLGIKFLEIIKYTEARLEHELMQQETVNWLSPKVPDHTLDSLQLTNNNFTSDQLHDCLIRD